METWDIVFMPAEGVTPYARGSLPPNAKKKTKFYDFALQTRGRGVNRISYLLFRIIYVLRNTVKLLNRDFVKAVGGVTVL